MRLSAYASRPQYWRHMAPVIAELERRGHPVVVWAEQHGQPWGPAFIDHQDSATGDVMIVASFSDAQRWRHKPCIWLDHGAGQTYDGAPVQDRAALLGYPGSQRLEHVALFCAPSARVAARWSQTYPEARTAVVGCPALDRYAGRVEGRHGSQDGGPRVPHSRPVVAFTCHHRNVIAESVPEQAPALPLYLEAIRALDRDRYDLIGHGHPRIQTEAQRWWADLGLRFEPDIDVVLSTADLLVCDSSSCMYEAAAIGLPVLALNAPTYRRDVEHGLRFWSDVPGVECDEPEHLDWSIRCALADPPELQALRTKAAAAAYDAPIGQASARAADAILSLLEGPLPMPTNPEIRDYTQEVIERAFMLGGDDAFAVSIRNASEQRIGELRRMNDTLLAQEIAAAREDAPKAKRGRASQVAVESADE